MDILEDIKPDSQGPYLVVGIDRNGNIKKCNDLFEKLTGTNNDTILNTPFLTFLSRNPSIVNSWMDILLKMKDNEDIPEIELPIQTRTGEDVVVSWTNFPLKYREDETQNVLNLVGMPINSASSSKKISETKNSKSLKNSTSKENTSKQQSIKKLDNKIAHRASINSNKIQTSTKMNDSSKKNTKKTSNETKKNIIKKDQKLKNTSKNKSKKIQKIEDEQGKKTNVNHKKKKSIQNKIENKDITTVDNRILQKIQIDSLPTQNLKGLLAKSLHKMSNDLEEKNQPKIINNFLKSKKTLQSNSKKNRKEKQLDNTHIGDEKSVKITIKNLKKENKKLQKDIKKLEERIELFQINRKVIKKIFNKRFFLLKNSIGIEKKRDEYRYMMDQMNQRKQKLEHLETDMILEKKEFKKKIEEFFTWREKLEQLEQEIEKRRKYLEEHESYLNENFDKVLQHELTSHAEYIQESIKHDENDENESQGVVEEDDLFESLTIEAVVLQRGRIKKVNSLFQKMIGFDEKDLVGKHLVDFVGPSGLAGVEQHYVNRLKGVDDLSYDTVFVTDKEKEIPVHVKVKTGEFQGQRAEIATFREK